MQGDIEAALVAAKQGVQVLIPPLGNASDRSIHIAMDDCLHDVEAAGAEFVIEAPLAPGANDVKPRQVRLTSIVK